MDIVKTTAHANPLGDATSLLVVTLFASTLVFFSAVFDCGLSGPCTGLTAYALSASAAGALVAGGYVAVTHYVPGHSTVASAQSPVAICLGVGWLVSAILLTSAGPFVHLGNGYVGSWLAAVASLRAAHVASARVRDMVDTAAAGFEQAVGASSMSVFASALLAASSVEVVAASLVCGAGGMGCSGYEAYAVAVGAVSLAATVFLVALPRIPGITDERARFARPATAAFLCAWWAAAALLLTFISPFKIAGNGFFSTWAAVLATARIGYEAWLGRNRTPADAREQGVGDGYAPSSAGPAGVGASNTTADPEAPPPSAGTAVAADGPGAASTDAQTPTARGVDEDDEHHSHSYPAADGRV